MKNFRILAKIVIFAATIFSYGYAYEFPANTQYDVCFTPGQQCTDKIVALINQAKQSIYVQAYSFTSRQIAHALVKAQQSGVKVAIIMDKSNFICKQFTFASYFIRKNIPVWQDDRVNIAHNKVIIIDDTIVETGSFNFTKAAEVANSENVLIINSKDLASLYLDDWNQRQKLSKLMNTDVCPNFRYW